MKWVLVVMCILATTVGDVFRSLGMRHHGEIHDFRPGAIGAMLAAIARSVAPPYLSRARAGPP